MSSFTSQTMVLLGFLVASSLCLTANAGRDLAETSKLAVLGGTVTSVTSEVMNLFADGGRTVDIVFTMNAVGVSSPVAMAVGSVQMEVAPGVVSELAPIAVAVKTERLVAITLTGNGKSKTVTVDLAAVTRAVVHRAVTTTEVTTAVSFDFMLQDTKTVNEPDDDDRDRLNLAPISVAAVLGGRKVEVP